MLRFTGECIFFIDLFLALIEVNAYFFLILMQVNVLFLLTFFIINRGQCIIFY